MLYKLRKIIIIFFISFFLLFLFSSVWSLIFLVLLFRVICFNVFWFYRGYCYFSMIFSLLFSGGIVVIFMIARSLYPNLLSSFSIKIQVLFSFFIFSFSFFYVFSYDFFLSIFNLKRFLFRGFIFFFLIFFVVFNFFCVINMLSSDSMSLRNYF